MPRHVSWRTGTGTGRRTQHPQQLALSGTYSATATVAGKALQLRTDATALQVLDTQGKVLASAAGRFERLTLAD
jgi:hypothetical protein